VATAGKVAVSGRYTGIIPLCLRAREEPGKQFCFIHLSSSLFSAAPLLPYVPDNILTSSRGRGRAPFAARNVRCCFLRKTIELKSPGQSRRRGSLCSAAVSILATIATRSSPNRRIFPCSRCRWQFHRIPSITVINPVCCACRDLRTRTALYDHTFGHGSQVCCEIEGATVNYHAGCLQGGREYSL